MPKPLSAQDQDRRKRQRAAVRQRELRRFFVTLVAGAAVYVVLTQIYPANDRGLAFVGLLGLGLVLAFVLGQVVDRLLEQRRLDRLATGKGPRT
jgi:hypothetical protein